MKGVELLKGKILDEIIVTKGTSDYDSICFKTIYGGEYKMAHEQDCCESVTIEDICGDLDDLIGSPIIEAEETTNSDEPRKVLTPDDFIESDDPYTWTFYKLATQKGHVTIRWYGTSNGCYSEKVDFKQIKKEFF